MKALLPLLMLFPVLASASLDELLAIPTTPEDLRNIPTVNLVQIEQNLPKYTGKIVKVKFTRRSKVIDEDKATGMWGGILWLWNAKEEYGAIDVWFPKAAVEWFSRIPVDVMSRKSSFAYVRIGSDGSDVIGVMMGREIKTGTKGPEFIW